MKPEDWDPNRQLGDGQVDDVARRIADELRSQLPRTQAEAIHLYGPLEFTHIQMDPPDPKYWRRLYFLTSLARKPDLYFLCYGYGSIYFRQYVDHAMVKNGPWHVLESRIPAPKDFKRIPWLTSEGSVVIGDITHPVLDGAGPSEPCILIPK